MVLYQVVLSDAPCRKFISYIHVPKSDGEMKVKKINFPYQNLRYILTFS